MESKVIGVKRPGITYRERGAVRLITQNTKNEIAIVHVKRGNYYKLPGGGVEEGEKDHLLVGQREAMEEIGCKVSIEGGCFAQVEEWRHDLHQMSYCYIAHLVEDTGAPELTADEVEDGLQHEWVAIDAVLDKMESCEPTSELGKYIRERDMFFVETYTKSAVTIS